MAGTAEGRRLGALDAAGVRVVLDNAAIQRLLSSANGPAAKAVLRAGVKVEAGAKRLCPVDTGRLRASITHRLETDGGDPVAYVGSNTAYAAYVEFGTRFSPAQPYLRPALRAAA